MAKDPIKKAENGTYYFRANLGYHPVTGKQIQKYRSGFSTKKEARAEYSKLILASTEELADKKEDITFKKFIEEIYLPWYKTQVKESTYKNRYSTIQKHFAYFYKKKVSEIEAINVQTWQLRLAKQFSPNYVRIVQGMLCLAFDRAIILGLAKKNPARICFCSSSFFRYIPLTKSMGRYICFFSAYRTFIPMIISIVFHNHVMLMYRIGAIRILV